MVKLFKAKMRHYEGETESEAKTALGAVMSVMQKSKGFMNRGAQDFKAFTIEVKEVIE